ncbi:porin [Candidatus Pelagibacter sp.]|nr:porin [Candidatus Pelagibacter sp.]
MNKLKTMGLTALAGTLAATTAQSVEMSVSGSVSVNYATDDTTEVTGARLTTGDSLNFTGSGETDQGWTVTSSIEIDGGTYDDRTLSVNMGDSGTVYFQSSGAQGTPASLVPNAYGSAGYSLAGSATPTGRHVADGLASGGGSAINLGYTVSVAGLDISAGMSPGVTGGSDTSVNVKYADLVDGLTVSIGRSDLNPSQAVGTEETSISASYVMGGLTVGYTNYNQDLDSAGGADHDARHYGISFAVNENLTVSYDNSSSDKATSSVDEETDSIQASYTMGNMKIKAHISKSDNEGYSSGADDETKAIDVSWSF